LREFIGTLNSDTVYCWVFCGGEPLGVDGDSGPDPGRDSSHLWHVHISVIRKFLNHMTALQQIASIVTGESVEQWRDRMEGDMPLTAADKPIISQAVFETGMGAQGTEGTFHNWLQALEDKILGIARNASNSDVYLWKALTQLAPEVTGIKGNNNQDVIIQNLFAVKFLEMDAALKTMVANGLLSEEDLAAIQESARQGAEAGAADAEAIANAVVAKLDQTGLTDSQKQDVKDATKEAYTEVILHGAQPQPSLGDA
jgi:hypothetical protein